MNNFKVEAIDILELAKEADELFSGGEAACSIQRRQCKLLVDKLSNSNMTISVIGQFKRGKSTLSNCILGKNYMPVGIVPITSAVTKVVYGRQSAEVCFENGEVRPVEIDDLSAYISEQENAQNKLGVKEVVIHSESDFLKNGITYVDTPGVGSFHKNNTEVAYDYMKESDAVIFLLSVDSPINQIEIDFLQSTKEYAGKFYFAVNKIDTVSAGDLEAYTGYCAGLLSEIMETSAIKLMPVSAKTGEGVEALKSAILRDLSASIREIMQESTRKKLIDIIGSALKELQFYRSAMSMPYEELDKNFAELSDFMNERIAGAEEHVGMFALRLNELRLRISKKIFELFDIEYSFDIEELPAGLSNMSKEEYLQRVKELCDDMQGKLSAVLLYKEDNAYAVIRRIEDTNKLTRRLRSLKNRVERSALKY
ncbi:Isoniazid-inductible protein iniA [[Eubacterium] infirmum]|nr:Isoniazid-inductible protein iniA [[Eubacterium] infirmum]